MYRFFFVTWGTITKLSRKYNVSRQFIYIETHKLEQSFNISLNNNNLDNKKLEKTYVIKQILSLRLVNKSSIIGISEHLSYFENKFCSVGFISGVLTKIGKLIGNKLDIDQSEILTIPICCDEIFAGQTPILVTIEPKSLSIIGTKLSDSRDANAWIEFWESIRKQNIEFSSLINDDGTGMESAREKYLSDLKRQRDTFHTVSHRLGLWKIRFASAQDRAIESECIAEELLAKAKSKRVRNKRKQALKQAIKKTHKAIRLNENFSFLYHCLLECFELFDKNGKLKDLLIVTGDFLTAVEYLKELNHEHINQEIKHINKDLNKLFYFYQTAQSIVNNLSTKIDVDILNQFCLAWQTHKKMLKAKQTDRKNTLKRKEQHLFKIVKELLEDQFEIIKNQIYDQLNNIIQSSALVECVNSILRPYLVTTKNQPTQEFLNLFMFYHNHRRFVAGERKGKTPWELLTGKKQDYDWLELLMNKFQNNC